MVSLDGREVITGVEDVTFVVGLWGCPRRVVYYETTKRVLNKRLVYECRGETGVQFLTFIMNQENETWTRPTYECPRNDIKLDMLI